MRVLCSCLNGEPPVDWNQCLGPFLNLCLVFIRASYPPYGLYVLNRVGAEDYIQGIYPEDEFVTSGQYLIVKSFPDFLARRLANLPSTANGEPHDRFSDVYTIPNIDQIDSKMKGRSTVVGLWTLASSSRESMDEVLKKCVLFLLASSTFCS